MREAVSRLTLGPLTPERFHPWRAILEARSGE
jgi:hypothetical protein